MATSYCLNVFEDGRFDSRLYMAHSEIDSRVAESLAHKSNLAGSSRDRSSPPRSYVLGFTKNLSTLVADAVLNPMGRKICE